MALALPTPSRAMGPPTRDSDAPLGLPKSHYVDPLTYILEFARRGHLISDLRFYSLFIRSIVYWLRPRGRIVLVRIYTPRMGRRGGFCARGTFQ